MLSEGVNLFAVCCYLDTINAQGWVEIGESFHILKVRCLMYPEGLKQKVVPSEDGLAAVIYFLSL